MNIRFARHAHRPSAGRRSLAIAIPAVLAGTLAACGSDPPIIVQQPVERERVVVHEQTPVPTIVVQQPPPATRTEVVPPAPSAQHIWVPGTWVWRDAWVWQPGHWELRPYAGARWIDGHWESTPDGWRWTPGRWG